MELEPLQIKSKANEDFAAVKDYEGLYEVSNHGYIRSIQRFQKAKNDSLRATPQRILKPYITKGTQGGYYRLALCKDNNLKSYLLHRLVAAAFVDNPNNLPEVNHKDGDKLNNYFENLEWVTREENMKHRIHVLKQSPPNRNKVVLNTETGVFYDSAKAAFNSKPFPFKLDHFHNILRLEKLKNRTSFIYV